MIKFLMAICRFNFGKFEEKEFRKFFRMGSIFFMLIGIYWTMRPLKDSLFIQLVGKEYIPYAKTVSFRLVMYGKSAGCGKGKNAAHTPNNRIQRRAKMEK